MALVATIVGVLLAVSTVTYGYTSLSTEVTLAVDGKERTVSTFGDTVQDVLDAEGIEVGSRDLVQPGVDEQIDGGDRISVRYSRPIELTLDGETSTHWVTATDVEGALDQIGVVYADSRLSTSRGADIDRGGAEIEVITPKRLVLKLAGKKAVTRTVPALTVEDALAEVGVELDEFDKVRPGREAEVADGDRIVFTDIEQRKRSVDGEVVPAPVREVEDDSMYEGERKVVTEGVDGVRDVTYRVIVRNGDVVQADRAHPGRHAGAARRGRPRRHQVGRGQLRRRQHGLGPARAVRVRRQLGHQHRQRLLRRPPVQPRHLAGLRRTGHAAPGLPRDPDRHRDQGARRLGRVRRLAALLVRARPAPLTSSRHPDTERTGPRRATARPGSACHYAEPMTETSAPRLLGPAEVRELAARLDLRPTKQRGQNFVIDANTVRRIVRESGVVDGEVVVEVGPGLGSLTLALLEVGATVTAIEIDPLLAGELPTTVAAHAPDAGRPAPGRARGRDERRRRTGSGAARRWSPTCPTTSRCRCCCT